MLAVDESQLGYLDAKLGRSTRLAEVFQWIARVDVPMKDQKSGKTQRNEGQKKRSAAPPLAERADASGIPDTQANTGSPAPAIEEPDPEWFARWKANNPASETGTFDRDEFEQGVQANSPAVV